MNRGTIKSLIAIAVLAALWFGFHAWNQRKTREGSLKAAKKTETALSIPSSKIDNFTVTSSDGNSFTCTRQGNTWAIVKPLDAPADQGKVSSFLGNLTSASIQSVVASHPTDLNDFGLAPPVETIQVSEGSNAPAVSFSLGNETPTSSGIYAQVSSNSRVFTLSDDLKTSLEKKMFDLRDTRAVTLDTSELQRIQSTAPKQSYSLIKNPEGVWEVSLPPDVRADHFGVESLVDDLQSLNMSSIVSEEKKSMDQYGFSHPTLTLQLATANGSQTLVIGKKAPSSGYYAMNSALTPVFTLGEDSVSQFQKNASDFRDKNLFSWDMFNVKKFDVTSSKGHFAFEHSKNEWRETTPIARKVSSDDVSDFLSALRGLTASSFPPATPGQLGNFGLDQPSYTFKVTYGSNNAIETVEVAQKNGHVYAVRTTDDLPSEVSESNLTSITNSFDTFSSPTKLAKKSEAATK